MKASVYVLNLAGFATASAAALEMRREVPEGYNIVPMTWTGPIFPGGKNYTFQGTAEAVIEQITKLNPEFVTMQQNQSASDLASRDLEARQPARIACDGGGPNGGYSSRTKVSDARSGIDYLKWLSGGACGAGAWSCARMTCNNGAEIWFCNDNDHYVEDRCDWQAYLAELVIDKCQQHIKADCWIGNPHCGNCGCKPIDDWVVMGAQYDVRNWNVMITNGPRNWYC